MSNIIFRKADKSDMNWLYQTFKITMREYIESTWGWDELFQHHSFHDNLPPTSFVIANVDSKDTGAYSVLEKKDHLWLEMVIVIPDQQGKGLGRILLQRVEDSAREKQKPVRLSVLKINPAQHFYNRLGFTATGEDIWSVKMEWTGSRL